MIERRLQVEARRDLTSRAFVLQYHCPEIATAARPGQFVMISAAEAVDPLLRRPMAFYEIIHEGGEAVGFGLLIEAVGRGTRLMARARPGDPARVLGPLGTPFEAVDGAGEHVLVMGGVGAAPFPLFAAELRERGLPVRAFIGGRTASDLLCVDDFTQLGVATELATEDGTRGTHGLVTAPLRHHLESSERELAAIYSCGPEPMMAAVDRLARAHRLPHRVSLEAPMACGLGVCLSCVVKVRDNDGWSFQRVCREGPVFDAGRLLWGQEAG